MKKIVVIEDDADIQDVFKIGLDADKYSILCFDNGNQFLQNPVSPPAVIMLDKNMPGISGLDLCARLKTMESYRNVPIVMMSADPDIEAEAKAAGANDTLVKPFRLAMLRTIIARYAG